MRRTVIRTRSIRSLLVAITTASVVGSGVVALPAAAAPAAGTSTSVRVVAGDRSITAAWSAVTGAAGYTVRVSAKRSLAKARTTTTTARSLRVKGLKNGTPYFVSVTPVAGDVVPATAALTASRVVSTTAGSGVPFPVEEVTATPGPLADQVTVSWTGGGRATKVGVVAGSNVTTDQRSFNSGWYPATTRSITITVPESQRAHLGAGSGNPVWVKVVQSNDASTTFGPSYSYERKYRPSPVGTWAFAKAEVPEVPVTKLKVAELNIQSYGATSSFTKDNRWAARAPRAADYVDDADPDLLMTAELATNVIDGCRNGLKEPYRCAGHTQVADLAKRLGRLKLAGTDAYARVMDQMRDFGGRWNGRSTNGAHVFYDPAKLELLDHGYFSPALPEGQYYGNVTGLGVSNWNGRNAIGPDRWVSWARLRSTDGSGRELFAVAAHLPVGPAAEIVTARQEEATKLAAAIDRIAGSTPVVLGADMNADSVRNAKPAQIVFRQRGWFDAAAVADRSLRSGMKVSTANGSGAQDGVDPGYGSRPVRHPYETSRIDYILLKNSPYTYRYANVLAVRDDGTFIKSQQGTDHNMQLATIGIADPPA